MKITLLIFLCSLQSVVFGHDYFFAFAEVEYNDISQRFEATISASSHDLERIFAEQNWSIDDLESPEENFENFAEISLWLLNQFTIECDNNVATFKVIGCEVELSGMIHFYIESSPIEISDKMNVKFDLLMENFPEQQNKLTFHHRDQTITKSFINTASMQEIKLENS